MKNSIELPPQLVKVWNSFLGVESSQEKFTEGFLLSVSSVMGQALKFSVYLDSGAVYSNLPINALCSDKYGPVRASIPMKCEHAQPFSCLNGGITYLKHTLLSDQPVELRCPHISKDLLFHGKYLFTLEPYSNEGLTEEPTQVKTHNIVCLSDGRLVAFPNHYLLFNDEYFAYKKPWPKYKRQDRHHFPNS